MFVFVGSYAVVWGASHCILLICRARVFLSLAVDFIDPSPRSSGSELDELGGDCKLLVVLDSLDVGTLCTHIDSGLLVSS